MSGKNFASNQDVRWCPGCGNYVVLATIQKLLAEMGILKENVAFISGIGCSSRFVYYMDTYGFHTIHGRATAVAAGLKIMRPDLSVWIVTGDGDGLSIGLGHLLHLMRRNIDVNILLLNNQIYGLTKGQYSPTSQLGVISNSSPFGSIDKPFNPIKLAMAAECSFVARAMDSDPKHLANVIKQATLHTGTSFIEVLQNCGVYNNDAFSIYREQQFRQDSCVYLQMGQPVRFGKQLEKGIQLINQRPVIKHDVSDANMHELLIHNATSIDHSSAILADMQTPEFPLALGIFKAIKRQSYHEVIANRVKSVKTKHNRTFIDVLNS